MRRCKDCFSWEIDGDEEPCFSCVNTGGSQINFKDYRAANSETPKLAPVVIETAICAACLYREHNFAKDPCPYCIKRGGSSYNYRPAKAKPPAELSLDQDFGC